MQNQNPLPPFFTVYPAVYATEHTYRIFVSVRSACVLWATVGEERFDDAVGGVLRSGTLCHHVSVPMETLDRAGEYVLHWRRIPERKPYFTQSGEEETAAFRFSPLPQTGNLRICHISDTHGLLREAIRAKEAAAAERDIDLILLTGDVHNHNGGEEQFSALPYLASGLAHGAIPIVYARGNHDTRGAYAEYLPEIAPTVNGKYYYTFRLGRLWGLVTDCGEDKTDDHPEYGFVNDFAAYREEETGFLRRTAERVASGQSDEAEIRWRLVISHIPFPFPKEPPFTIERERYAEWCRLIGESVRPDLMISGHLHVSEVCVPGGKRDKEHIQFCPILLSGRADHENRTFTCGVLTLTENEILPQFVSSDGTVCTESPIPLANRSGNKSQHG